MAVNVAVVGVTGAVGQEFLKLLDQRNFPGKNYKFLASARSAGKTLTFKGTQYTIEELNEDSFDDVDIALFSAGGSISKKFCPIAAQAGAVAVHPFAHLRGGGKLGHDLRIPVDDPGEIHHLGKKMDIVALEQRFHVPGR